ncbi:unnamed protein product [Linum trigynum]|uniref:Uncharacterized protein n=1 Tax=Linum trigynum TaxID=586398 RepID=A0AAV2GJZ2_9ROSI
MAHHHLLLHLFLVALSLLTVQNSTATSLQPNNHPASSTCKGKLRICKNTEPAATAVSIIEDDGGSGQEAGQRRKLLQKIGTVPPVVGSDIGGKGNVGKVPGAGSTGGKTSGKKDKKNKGKKGKKQ